MKLLMGAMGVLAAVAVVLLVQRSYACQVTQQEVEVRGSSLHGIIEGGETVVIREGHYRCNPIARGDIVEYLYAGPEGTIVKIVKAVPGDVWRTSEGTSGRYSIEVNGQALRNSFGHLYQIDAKRASMLQLYIGNYGGVIPPNAYLILGNTTDGSVDSTAFGLISASDILGKVVLPVRSS